MCLSKSITEKSENGCKLTSRVVALTTPEIIPSRFHSLIPEGSRWTCSCNKFSISAGGFQHTADFSIQSSVNDNVHHMYQLFYPKCLHKDPGLQWAHRTNISILYRLHSSSTSHYYSECKICRSKTSNPLWLLAV